MSGYRTEGDTQLPFAKGFRDLIAYQKTRQLQREVFEVSKKFPPEEKYSLTDQIRRGSRSIGSQIAEAWAKIRYERHFISKLTDGLGEEYETEHWLETARDDGYLDSETASELVEKAMEIGRLINGMISKSAKFCLDPDSTRIREGDDDLGNFFSDQEELRFSETD